MSAFGRYFFAPLSLPALRAVLLFFSVLWVCRVSLRVPDWQRFIGCLVGRRFVVLGRLVFGSVGNLGVMFGGLSVGRFFGSFYV